jgi:hypothetical protein
VKAFLWLQTIAFAVVCWIAWVVADAVAECARFNLMPIANVPAVARLIVPYHTWLLFCPLPWVAYAALLSRRRDLTVGATLIFGGTLSVAAVIIVCVVALGGLGIWTW